MPCTTKEPNGFFKSGLARSNMDPRGEQGSVIHMARLVKQFATNPQAAVDHKRKQCNLLKVK